MSAPICLSCKRIKATNGEWEAMLAHGACDEPDCVWGEDRCWNSTACALTPEDVEAMATAAKDLRHGRPLGVVVHLHDRASTEAASAL